LPRFLRDLVLRCAVLLPGGGRLARLIEQALPSSLLVGGFLAVAADVR